MALEVSDSTTGSMEQAHLVSKGRRTLEVHFENITDGNTWVSPVTIKRCSWAADDATGAAAGVFNSGKTVTFYEVGAAGTSDGTLIIETEDY